MNDRKQLQQHDKRTFYKKILKVKKRDFNKIKIKKKNSIHVKEHKGSHNFKQTLWSIDTDIIFAATVYIVESVCVEGVSKEFEVTWYFMTCDTSSNWRGKYVVS